MTLTDYAYGPENPSEAYMIPRYFKGAVHTFWEYTNLVLYPQSKIFFLTSITKC